MKKATLENHQGSQYAKILTVSQAKTGKTVFLAASALGCLPWQKEGGIVDKPENLAILSVDAGASSGILSFLLETCQARPEVKNITIYNLEDDLRSIATSGSDYDNTFYNTILTCLRDFEQCTGKGVACLIPSSLTGIAEGVKRGIAGPPNSGKKSPMDQNKWGMYDSQMSELRNRLQLDRWHTIWEGHIVKGGEEDKEDRLPIQGSVGKNFPYNVEHVFQIVRERNQPYEKTKCDKAYLNTQPTLTFVNGGRQVTERLNPKEPDLAAVLRKLGKTVGGWNQK